MKIFAAYNDNPDIRKQSSSGGIFSVLAKYTLANGGVIYGASFDTNWNISHKRIISNESISLLRGSKYAFSNVGTSYKDALSDLTFGRLVLFSGTPCQIAAMRKLAGDHPLLLLVEIVCHGAPSPEYWSRYLAELCQQQSKTIDDIEAINFRDKRTGWKNYSFTIRFKNGETFTQPHDDNLYMRAFLQNLTLRKSCFVCPFKCPHGTKADITIGDLWGISQIAPEIDDDKGISLVIVHTKRGIELLKSVPLITLNYENVLEYNPAIALTPKEPLNYDLFKRQALSSDNLIKILKKHSHISFRLKLSKFIHRIFKSYISNINKQLLCTKGN